MDTTRLTLLLSGHQQQSASSGRGVDGFHSLCEHPDERLDIEKFRNYIAERNEPKRKQMCRGCGI